jgi:hypothetical protein
MPWSPPESVALLVFADVSSIADLVFALAERW